MSSSGTRDGIWNRVSGLPPRDLPPPGPEIAALVERAQVLSLKPGDVLVLHHPHVLSPDGYQRLRALVRQLEAPLGFRPFVMIAEEGITLSVLRAELLEATSSTTGLVVISPQEHP